MEDKKIIELYFARSETAIAETDKKYGKYCYCIANSILSSREDAEETVSDTYLKIWEAIPPHMPNPLKGYVGMIANRLALNRYESQTAAKRGNGQVPLVLEELSECVSGKESDLIDMIALQQSLNRFLSALPKKTRSLFVRRYWYAASLSEIATEFDISEGALAVLMHRTRKKLRKFLCEEGFDV